MPFPIAVTRPFSSTFATLSSSLDHIIVPVASAGSHFALSCSVAPLAIVVDVSGRVEPCGQLLIQGIAAVCGHASGEPVLHRVVLCPELRPAKADKTPQHHHDAQSSGNSLFAQRGWQGLFEACQLLLEGRQPHFLLGGRCGAIAGSVKAAGGSILLSGKICVCHFSSGSPSSSVSARLRCG